MQWNRHSTSTDHWARQKHQLRRRLQVNAEFGMVLLKNTTETYQKNLDPTQSTEAFHLTQIQLIIDTPHGKFFTTQELFCRHVNTKHQSLPQLLLLIDCWQLVMTRMAIRIWHLSPITDALENTTSLH